MRQLAERLGRARMTLAIALASALGAAALTGCTVPLQGTCVTCDSEDAGALVDATSGVGPSVDAASGGSTPVGTYDAKGGNGSVDAEGGSPAPPVTDETDASTSCSEDGACAEAGSEDECEACCSEGGCEPDESSTPGESDAAMCALASDCPAGEACNTSTSQCQASCSGALCNGCCDATGNCQPGTDPSGCGNDGGLCATCTDGRTCMEGSYCSCRQAVDCPAGLACKQGTGECQPSCNGGALCNGCCDQGYGTGMCQAGTSPTQCNTGGHTCQVCACPKPVCVPYVANAGAASIGGTCGCSIDEDCKPACSGPNGQYRSVCTAASCQ